LFIIFEQAQLNYIIMGLLNLLKRLIPKPRFNGTPEMFLALVMEMQVQNNKKYSRQEVLQWGEVMQKMIRVKLDPYQDFADLMDKGVPDFTMVEKMKRKLKKVHQRRDLKQAIYGENADLGDDDVMKSNSKSAVFARNFVKEMSKHVQFSE
jgi:hypothetical protein